MSYPLHIPGPWTVRILSKPQMNPYVVVRHIEDGTFSSPHYEQLRDENGGIARFQTVDEAEAAITRATGESA